MSATLALLGGPKAITRSEEMAAASRWPVYSDEEKAAVLEAMGADNIYASTPLFEQEFAAYHGVRYALAHCNGSCAIHAACFAVGIQPGDEVLTSAYTWHLQVGQILALHAIPVFCDIDPRSACIDPEEIRRKITGRTRAIIVVHPFGALAPMDEIVAIGKAHGIPVIEDCSHAHGAKYRGRKVGTLGDIACFSLQASKLMNAIEGGILITNNQSYYERACVLAHYDHIPGLTLEENRRFCDPTQEQAPACFGFKYRIHPLASAIARVQLRHLDEWNAIRRNNHGYLTQRLAAIGRDIVEPPFEEPENERTWLNYICRYQAEYAGVPRDTFLEALRAEGLPATGGRAGYLPIYWNPLYSERVGMWAEGDPFDAPAVSHKVTYERGLCPVTETFWRRCINLPMLHRPVSRELLDEIVEAVDKAVCNLTELQKRAYPPRAVAPAASRPASVGPQVAYSAPVAVDFETEPITDTGGYQFSGGTGRSCWGYHQSNIVRHGEEIYALCWQDDTHLVVFHRTGPGVWEASPPLPESPQSGALLVDGQGCVHLIAGNRGSYHARFEAPGQVQRFSVQYPAKADTRFGASIAPNGDIFVAGGMPAMRWYRLCAEQGYAAVESGCLPHETNRAYYFVAFDGRRAQTYCHQVHYVEEVGFQTMQTYYYTNPDVARDPDDWRMTLIGDVADTFNGRARGVTRNEDLLIDRKGRVHFLYMRNATPTTGAWASQPHDLEQNELYHVVGTPDGPFQHFLLGAFVRGRLCQTSDGRLHYLLTRREAIGARLWHAVGDEDCFDVVSEPTLLETPGPIDHMFVNNARAGSTLAECVDCYFTGPYPGGTKNLWYGRLTVPGPAR